MSVKPKKSAKAIDRAVAVDVMAKRKGFSGLSDYVRAAAMEVAR